MKFSSSSSSPEQLVQQASYFLQSGELLQAANIFKKLLGLYPKNTQLLTKLGAIELQLGNFEEGIKLLSKSLKITPMQPEAIYNYAIGLSILGRFDEALKSYDRLIALNPRNAEAYDNRGNVLQELERYDDALISHDRAIVLNPDYPEAYNNRGLTLLNLKRYEDALESFNQAIALSPNYAEAHNNKGNALQSLSNYEDALVSYNKAISLNPNYAKAYYNCGVVLNDLKRYEDALTSYDHAIGLTPNYAEAHNNRGVTLHDLKRYEDALASYNFTINLNPNYAEAYFNRGVTLYDLIRYEEALESYDRAIVLKPGYAEAYYNSGITLHKLKRYADALESYNSAIRLKPDFARAFNNRGNLLQEMQHYEEALASYERALEFNPDIDFLVGSRLHTKMHLCDWAGIDTQLDEVVSAIENAKKACVPFEILALTDDPKIQKECAEIYSTEVYPSTTSFPEIKKYPNHNKIRIGYFSADFHNHATMHLMAELFENHDKNKFELIAFSFGPNIEDIWRRRAIEAFDKFIDVRLLSDEDVTLMARSLEIDIAIDLKGFTSEGRTAVFANRAAPVQVNYLGYPGTMGAEYIDYLIADRTLIPEDKQQYYSEKIVYLPYSYQVNVAKRDISNKVFNRADFGLPEEAFVFCCFNNIYKITPTVFDSWMQILLKTNDSVIWLYSNNALAIKNLCAEANKKGIDSDRLIFATPMKVEEHLARLKLADLFLDTLPYNAHTTASDALRVGLPILTCAGESFAGRVAASLLNTIKIPELIAQTQEEYIVKAVHFATDRDKLNQIKQTIIKHLPISPLYDSELFTSHIESAYLEMYRRQLSELET